jgi:hypothetical protein
MLELKIDTSALTEFAERLETMAGGGEREAISAYLNKCGHEAAADVANTLAMRTSIPIGEVRDAMRNRFRTI